MVDAVNGFFNSATAAKKAGSGGGDDSSVIGDFSQMLGNAVQDVVDNQKEAEKLTVAAASGDNVAMHEVIQAMSKAELTLNTMMTVRDRAVEAYQEVLRMPI